ncbi:PKD-like family lipoprotein [Bacteroides sp.]|uniref:PKD-like family lipoprotein n=1 Tax=Bacteroides sp. TaxID=29523 RepID=UPI00262BAF33|nr:PKD-like family lipoprotein [Bacteroides sp.]MDD3039992.1 PKD-like family lipoprotein [Bacteroides sp.]
MRTIQSLFISISLLGLLSACYDDKGNYDYKDLTEIEIAKENPFSVTIGATVKITPDITYSKENPRMNLVYTWTLEGEVISTSPILEWVSDRYTTIASDNLILEITDLDNDLVYRRDYTLKVKRKYDTYGYFVLAKKDGKVCVHMIKEAEDEDGKRTYIPEQDIYSLENNGELLPSATFKLHEHFCLNLVNATDKDPINQLMFVAPDQTVEVEPSTFQKVDTELQDMFGGALPSGLMVSDIYFMQFLNLIKDREGRLYSRIKSSNEFFHIDQFLPTPLMFDKEELRDIEFIPSHLSSQHCLLYDKNKKRLLMIWDFKDYYGENYTLGKIEEVSSKLAKNAVWPDKVPTIEDAFKNYEVRHLASYKTEFNSYGDGLVTHYFAVLKDPQNGKLYHYKFALQQQYEAPVMQLFAEDGTGGSKVVSIEFKELTGNVFDLFNKPENKIFTLPTRYLGYGFYGFLTLIAQGQNLYVYNRATPLSDKPDNKNPRLLCSFDAEIAFMAGINSSHYWGEYMGVALKDGSFEVLSLRNANYSNWNGRVWKSTGLNLGEPIDLIYSVKSPNLDSWK